MIHTTRILLAVAFMAFLVSCKNENTKTAETEVTETEESVSIPEKKVLTQEEKDAVNSVMTKVMLTPELKTFSSTLVSGELTEMLAKQKGPFTILAPSSEAFAAVEKETFNALTNPENKEQLQTLLKGHIVEGSMDSAQLVQAIKKDGNHKITTLAGTTLTATMKGSDIVISDANGSKAVVGKSDISGSNGVVHVLDKVLNVN